MHGDYHFVDPLPFKGTAQASIQHLREVISFMDGANIVRYQPDYLQVEFSSTVWHFIDDAEFLVDPGAKVIQLRSSSRIGYSDLGVNRRRIQTIRDSF